MKSARSCFLVLVTAPDRKVARRLARLALESKLAACANLIPQIESHYWWQGKLETSREILLLFKTTRPRLASLERLILQEHPYDTAEFLAVPLASGSPGYLQWLEASVAP